MPPVNAGLQSNNLLANYVSSAGGLCPGNDDLVARISDAAYAGQGALLGAVGGDGKERGVQGLGAEGVLFERHQVVRHLVQLDRDLQNKTI